MSSKHEHVIVIGAGLGGLATALRLQFAGFQVTVLEKLARPGGRSNVIEEQGFRVDTGPTLLLMKDTFEETYRAVGQDLQQRLKLIQLDPHYRIYYHDGTYLDLFANMAQLAQEVERLEPGSRERLFRFLGAGAKKYELAMDFVVRNYTRITDLANPSALTRLMQTRAYENMYRQVSKYFNGSDKLAKAFTFHSMFLGLSPYDSLAMYSMITYADMALGMWFPMGGIYSVVEDMVRLGQELGFELRTNSPVQEILVESGKVSGIRLQSGEQLLSPTLICHTPTGDWLMTTTAKTTPING
ncbi:MAG: phytoene desaturase [Chloroflexi bacterium]|nr:phytoene desaturase [Chloroflexota bacterium]